MLHRARVWYQGGVFIRNGSATCFGTETRSDETTRKLKGNTTNERGLNRDRNPVQSHYRNMVHSPYALTSLVRSRKGLTGYPSSLGKDCVLHNGHPTGRSAGPNRWFWGLQQSPQRDVAASRWHTRNLEVKLSRLDHLSQSQKGSVPALPPNVGSDPPVDCRSAEVLNCRSGCALGCSVHHRCSASARGQRAWHSVSCLALVWSRAGTWRRDSRYHHAAPGGLICCSGAVPLAATFALPAFRPARGAAFQPMP